MEEEIKKMFEIALKNEIESQKMYEKMMAIVKNPVFKERLKFILMEEKGQEEILKYYFSRYNPDEELKMPEYVEHISFEGKNMKEVLEKLMDFELTSRELYVSIYDEVPEKETELRKLFYYFVRMELTHYQILEAELESVERFEEDENYFPHMEIYKKEVKE